MVSRTSVRRTGIRARGESEKERERERQKKAAEQGKAKFYLSIAGRLVGK